MAAIKPIINIINYNTNKAASYLVKSVTKISSMGLKPTEDRVCFNSLFSSEEVKLLFPNKKLENNYIIDNIKTLLKNIETNKKNH